MQFYPHWPNNDDEKWSRKNVFEIPPLAKVKCYNSFLDFCTKLNSVTKVTFFLHLLMWCMYFVGMIKQTLSQKYHPYSILSTSMNYEILAYCMLST